MILVSTGNKELHSETSLDGIGSSGHDFSDEFLINVMTSVNILNSVIVDMFSGNLSETKESTGMASSFLRMFSILPIKYLPTLLANVMLSGTCSSL